MKSGIVTRYNSKRGFGSISLEDNPSLFFHFRGIDPQSEFLFIGSKVEFNVGQREDGTPQAVNIVAADEAPSGLGFIAAYDLANKCGKIASKGGTMLTFFGVNFEGTPERGDFVEFSSGTVESYRDVAWNLRRAQGVQDGVVEEWDGECGKFLDRAANVFREFSLADLPLQSDGRGIAAGEEVLFLVRSTDEGERIVLRSKDLPAPETCFGIITGANIEKRWQLITLGGDQKAIFFPHADFLKKGAFVSCRIERAEKGLLAKDVRVLEAFRTLYGEVTAMSKSGGRLLPVQGQSELEFKASAFVSLKKEGRRLVPGDAVSYLVDPEDESKILFVIKDKRLRRFARLGDEAAMLRELSGKVLEGEEWEYSYENPLRPLPILESYLFQTYAKLEDEDLSLESGRKKICKADGERGVGIAIFNTGLIDNFFKDLYAVFTENQVKKPGHPPYILQGFCTTGQSIQRVPYLAYVASLPDRAEYFKDIKEVIFDPTLRLDSVTEHIIEDRSYRLLPFVSSIPSDMSDQELYRHLHSKLEDAIKRAKDRIRWNYKAAIPQYYPTTKSIQFLLPLSLGDDPRKVDVALTVEKRGMVYIGHTILELDWAYSNARLIARPESEWLTPKAIVPGDAKSANGDDK